MSKLKFSAWAKRDNRTSQLENLQRPGIYALRISKSNIEGEAFDWVEEIVYFGMTNSLAGLNGRLTQFDNTLRDKSGGGHGGADRFRYIYPHSGEPLAKILYVAVCSFKNQGREISAENLLVQGQVAMAEYVAFAEYFKRYSALPKYNDKKASPKHSKRAAP